MKPFFGCTGLRGTLTLPDSLTEWKAGGWQDLAFDAIIFGSGLQSVNGDGLGYNGFSTIKTVTFRSAQIPGGDTLDVLNMMYQAEKIYVPKDSYIAYRDAIQQRGIQAQVLIEGVTGEFLIENGVLVGYIGQNPTVTIPDAVHTIGAGVFQNNNLITHVILPGSVTKIEAKAFSSCQNLAQVDFAEGLTEIGAEAFSYCERLKGELRLPESLRTIGAGAFGECAFTGPLNLPAQLQEIGVDAFYDCQFTGELRLPAGLQTLGSGAFGYCSGFTGKLVVPDQLTILPVEVFYGMKNITEVILGSGMQEVGAAALGGMTALKSVTCTGAQMVNFAPFHSVGPNFEGIYVPEALYPAYKAQEVEKSLNVSILVKNPTNAFYVENGRLLGYLGTDPIVRVPDGVTKIAPAALKRMKHITEVILPAGVTKIGDYAFANCPNLQKVQLAAGLQEIGRDAFYYCQQLKPITFPEGLRSIGQEAFAYCIGMQGPLHLPDSLQMIGPSAFMSCAVEGVLEFPASLQSVGSDAFMYCGLLTGLSEMSPDLQLGQSAFAECENLSGVVELPANSTRFAPDTFSRTAITHLIVGENVTALYGTYASMPALETVTLKPMNPPKNLSYLFEYQSGIKTVFVPQGSVESYRKQLANDLPSGAEIKENLLISGVANLRAERCYSKSVALA